MQDLSASITGLSQHERLEKFTAATFLPRPKLLFKASTEAMRLRGSAAEALFYFFSNRQEFITRQHFADIDFLFEAAYRKVKAFLQVTKWIAHDEVLTVHDPRLQYLAHDGLFRLLELCRNENFAINLVDNAVNGDLQLPSPFSEAMAICHESYNLRSGMTCLRFVDGDQCFFLMQRIASVDGIYFPLENIAVAYGYFYERHVEELQTKILNDFFHITVYSKASNHFVGLLASQKRPAHFYYETLPDLVALAQRPELLKKIPCIITRSSCDFNDLDLLSPISKNVVLSQSQIEELTLYNNGWVLQLGTHRYFRKNNVCYEASDYYLHQKIMAFPPAPGVVLAKQVEGCYPLVWVGIESQKRCWLEQIDGYAYILNQLSERFPNLGVVIDGWTTPITASEANLAEAANDKRLAQKLFKLLNANIKHIQTIGENSNVKIFVGSRVDFFICNFATGSLHVSRILRKPGFCHLSQALAKYTLQASIQNHPNRYVFLLPLSCVKDKPNEGFSLRVTLQKHLLKLAAQISKPKSTALQLGAVSYSIDKQQFWHFIEPRLDKILNPPPARLRLFIEPSFSIHYDVRQPIKMACYGNLLEVFPTFSFPKSLADLTGFSDRYLYNQVIYGVFPFSGGNVLGKPADYLLWLGDPLRRVLLHAAQFVKNAQAANQAICLAEVLTHGHKALDNYYTRQLSGMDAPYGGCHEGMLDRAIHNLRGQFIFIGINERQSESFDRLCQVMDWDRGLFPDQLSADFEAVGVNDAEAALAQQLIGYDLRLYQAALAMTESPDNLATLAI